MVVYGVVRLKDSDAKLLRTKTSEENPPLVGSGVYANLALKSLPIDNLDIYPTQEEARQKSSSNTLIYCLELYSSEEANSNSQAQNIDPWHIKQINNVRMVQSSEEIEFTIAPASFRLYESKIKLLSALRALHLYDKNKIQAFAGLLTEKRIFELCEQVEQKASQEITNEDYLKYITSLEKGLSALVSFIGINTEGNLDSHPGTHSSYQDFKKALAEANLISGHSTLFRALGIALLAVGSIILLTLPTPATAATIPYFLGATSALLSGAGFFARSSQDRGRQLENELLELSDIILEESSDNRSILAY